MNPERLSLIHAFAHLTEAELAAVATRAQETSAPAGTTLIRESDFANDLIVLFDGEVTVTRGEVTVARLGAGEIVGEQGCVSGDRRNATVTATTAVQFARLTHWDLRHLELTAPEALAAIRGVGDERDRASHAAA